LLFSSIGLDLFAVAARQGGEPAVGRHKKTAKNQGSDPRTAMPWTTVEHKSGWIQNVSKRVPTGEPRLAN